MHCRQLNRVFGLVMSLSYTLQWRVLVERLGRGCALNKSNSFQCFHTVKTTLVNTMNITTPAVSFIPQALSPPETPAQQPGPTSVAPQDQPLSRSKRALKGNGFFSWFGSKPPAATLAVPIPKPKPGLKPKPQPDLNPKPVPVPKPGPAPKPEGGLKHVAQAITDKLKANDKSLLESLGKHSTTSVAEVTKRLIDAESLVKAGVISTTPKASQVARDAFISAGITGLVSAPMNVAAYAGSVASGEAIKATYAPGVLPPPFLPGATRQGKAADNTASQSTPMVDSIAVVQDSIDERLDDFEMKLLGMATTVMFMLGDTRKVFTKDESWPKDEAGRLGNVEKLLGESEQQLKKATRQNGIIFKPYKPGEQIPDGAKDRLDLMGKKYERMLESYDKLRYLAAMKNLENQSETSVTA